MHATDSLYICRLLLTSSFFLRIHSVPQRNEWKVHNIHVNKIHTQHVHGNVDGERYSNTAKKMLKCAWMRMQRENIIIIIKVISDESTQEGNNRTSAYRIKAHHNADKYFRIQFMCVAVSFPLNVYSVLFIVFSAMLISLPS